MEGNGCDECDGELVELLVLMIRIQRVDLRFHCFQERQARHSCQRKRWLKLGP